MFQIVLKELRESRRLSQASFAKEIGVTQGTVGNWESGIREPNFDTVKSIANYFGVSVDKLLGNSPFTEAQLQLIRTHLEELTEDNIWSGISPSEYDGYRLQSMLDAIIENKKKPTYEDLFYLADEFDCSVEDILYAKKAPKNKKKPAASNGDELDIPNILNNTMVAFHRGEFEDLTQDEVDRLAEYAEFIKAQRAKREAENL